jgi:S-adenosylmethionine:tRNA ribosyltransferase-isomerase
MQVDLFGFQLPQELIALRPTYPRDNARMLVVEHGTSFLDKKFCDITEFLCPGDVLVFNDTKVIPARLSGYRQGRGNTSPRIEATLHKQQSPAVWRAFAKPARKLQPGDSLVFGNLEAEVIAIHTGGEITLQFAVETENFYTALAQAGVMPLPPYIAARRSPDAHDLDDYQTVYANREGAVASPTAGLHFTAGLLEKISQSGVAHQFVTLHVGAGTFLPVKSEDTSEHKMHAEWGEITLKTASAINLARSKGGRIIAVGTTALRLLESAVSSSGLVEPFRGNTDIFITPGHKFKAVDMLVTNFHLPRSTLFMLVAAFSGLEKMQKAYAYAIAERYKFYSYGDACLLFPQRST